MNRAEFFYLIQVRLPGEPEWTDYQRLHPVDVYLWTEKDQKDKTLAVADYRIIERRDEVIK